MGDPMRHYRRYEETYGRISDELETLRRSFESADRKTQKSMLIDSMTFAVMSVQNDISLLRRAFRSYSRSDSWENARESFRSLNYGNNKYDYAVKNAESISGDDGDEIIDMLESGNVWGATEYMVENLIGVSWVKAPFIGAMLGFTDLMCVDTNVAQMVPGAKAKGYNSMKAYRATIRAVAHEYPDLADEVSTFMLQWVVFDANRGDGVARHEEWFESMLPGTTFGHQTSLNSF